MCRFSLVVLAVLLVSGCASPGDLLTPCPSSASVSEAERARGEALYRFQTSSGRWGYMASDGVIVVPAQFESASVFQEGRASVRVEGQVGVIDPSGRLVVDPAYEAVDLFVDGRARVAVGEGGRTRYGYIDPAGQEIVAPTLLSATVFGDGVAVAEVERSVSGWLRQVITRIGVLGPPTQTVGVGRDGGEEALFDHQFVGAFSEGLAPFQPRSSQRWGYLAPDGSVAITPSLGRAFGFTEGLARVERDGRIGYIDTAGRPAFEATFTAAESYSSGRAAVQIDGRWGYIDPTGSVVIPAQFDQAGSFVEGLAAVQRDGRWGYIHPDRTVAIDPIYTSAQAFRGALALVADASGTYSIDRLGQPVRPRL